jgi:acyl carrier protein
MTRDEIAARVRQLIAEHTGRVLQEVVDTARLADDLGCDSLDKLELVLIVEDQFGVDIDDDRTSRMVTVGDAVQVVLETAGPRP